MTEVFYDAERDFEYDEYDIYDYDYYVDPRVNPCPDCDYGEVISTAPLGVPFYEHVCSAGCGWSA